MPQFRKKPFISSRRCSWRLHRSLAHDAPLNEPQHTQGPPPGGAETARRRARNSCPAALESSAVSQHCALEGTCTALALPEDGHQVLEPTSPGGGRRFRAVSRSSSTAGRVSLGAQPGRHSERAASGARTHHSGRKSLRTRARGKSGAVRGSAVAWRTPPCGMLEPRGRPLRSRIRTARAGMGRKQGQ